MNQLIQKGCLDRFSMTVCLLGEAVDLRDPEEAATNRRLRLSHAVGKCTLVTA